MGGVVRRHIDFLILLMPTPLVLAIFGSSILTSLFILKMFFLLVFVISVQYSKRCSKSIRDRSKIKITPTWQYNYVYRQARILQAPIFYGSCELALCMIIVS